MKQNVYFIQGQNIIESPSKTSMHGYHTMLGFCLGDFTKSLRAKVAENQRHIVTQWRLVVASCLSTQPELPKQCLRCRPRGVSESHG